jgi:adenine-specific DNA-methyltransferase
VALAPAHPVLTNDALEFTTAFARARFTPQKRRPVDAVLRSLWPHYQTGLASLQQRFERQYAEEEAAVRTGLGAWSSFMRRRTAEAVALPAVGVLSNYRAESYSLATAYFGGGYFGTRQAMELDAIRYALDVADLDVSRDWLLSTWLSAGAAIINTPGHTAQFLKPTSPSVAQRILRQRRRSAWGEFASRLEAVQPVGDASWRRANRVTSEEALDIIGQRAFDSVGVVYADPPYTKDQYSRYYHVYETLYLYDYPGATGEGRYRQGRFRTGFSLASEVGSSFQLLIQRIAARGLPLVLSYPASGLLTRCHVEVADLLASEFRRVSVEEVEADHSTFGASTGSRSKKAMERIYVASN